MTSAARRPLEPGLPALVSPLLLALLILLVHLPSSAQIRISKDLHRPDPSAHPFISPDQAKSIILDAYQIYGGSLRASGHDLDLTLSHFRTVPEPAFARHLWSALFTPPGGELLRVSPVQLEYADGAQLVHFEAEWGPADRVYSGELDTAAAGYRHLTVAEVRASFGEDRPALAHTRSITTYQVSLRFEEHRRTYRAAFLWFSTDGPALSFQPIDHVAQGLSATLAETLPIQDHPAFRARPLPQEELFNLAGAQSTCLDMDPTFWSLPAVRLKNTTEHASKNHRSVFGMDGTCDLNADCNSICTPVSRIAGCLERGELTSSLRVHRVSERIHLKQHRAYLAKSECSGAYGCAIESCVIGTCSGVSWTLSGDSGSLSYTAGGKDLLIDLSLESAAECPANQTLGDVCESCSDTSNPDTTDTGSGGGGGGTGDPDCTFICTYTFDPVERKYTEVCYLDC